MSQAEQIRKFVFDQYITPARRAGRSDVVVVRAGDVHRDMGLANAMPAVCSAIGGQKFEELAGLTCVGRKGPTNGANVFFSFHLTPGGRLQGTQGLSLPPWPTSRVTPPSDELELSNSIALISCVKTKLSYPAPARSLYISSWFKKARALVESSGARWFLLSSAYGLVSPTAEIKPYDYTLNSVGVAERRRWAEDVLQKLVPELRGQRRITMFAGARYREFLIEPLERRGVTIIVPMAHLTRGEQLQWLAEHE
jgi:hypothetical protein